MSDSALPVYTWDEIRKHNTDKDCWVVLYGRVLDVTEFLNVHPGGLNPICDLGGYDITNSFESIGHSSTALVRSKGFIIGNLDKSSIPPKVVRKHIEEDVSLRKYKAGGEIIPMRHILGAILVVVLMLYYFS